MLALHNTNLVRFKEPGNSEHYRPLTYTHAAQKTQELPFNTTHYFNGYMYSFSIRTTFSQSMQICAGRQEHS